MYRIGGESVWLGVDGGFLLASNLDPLNGFMQPDGGAAINPHCIPLDIAVNRFEVSCHLFYIAAIEDPSLRLEPRATSELSWPP